MQSETNCESEFAEALSSLDAYTTLGRHTAYETINLMYDDIETVRRAIDQIISNLDDNHSLAENARSSLTKQLTELRTTYKMLPYKTVEDVQALPNDKLEISLFGRTTAGKSTLMSILTHGDGSQIGNGSQRTTRDVRTYLYQNLKVTDMPGTGAFEGDDDKLAMDSVKRGDIVIFLFKDDAPQLCDATFLSRVKKLGKPVILLFNVFRGGQILEGREEDGVNDLCENIDDAFWDPDELDQTRKSLLQYGPLFQQDWSQIPYAYAHLKSAFLAQRPGLEPWSEQLRRASRFEQAIGLVNLEVRTKGVFFRLKSYLDTVSTALVQTIEGLFAMSCENLSLSSNLKTRFEEFARRREQFSETSRMRIEALTSRIESELSEEAAVFAEEHYNDKDVDQKWKQAVHRHDHVAQAQKLLEELERECHTEIRELAREISFDIKSNVTAHMKEQITPHNVFDDKRIVGWASAALGAGAFALGLLNLPAAGIFGALGIIAGVGSIFMKSGEAKRDEARRELQAQLSKVISEYASSMQSTLLESVESKLVNEMLNPISTYLAGLNESIQQLAETQGRLATKLAERQGNLSVTLMKEALKHLGYEDEANVVTSVARIPGNASILVLDRQYNISLATIDELSKLLHESIRDVVISNGYDKIPISRIAGHSLYDGSVTVKQVGELPVIDIVTNKQGNLAGRLAMQLINNLDVWR